MNTLLSTTRSLTESLPQQLLDCGLLIVRKEVILHENDLNVLAHCT